MSAGTCDCQKGNCECECSCDCEGCRGERGFQHRYQTKGEQIAELDNYLKDLKLEVQAVEERLTDLRK